MATRPAMGTPTPAPIAADVSFFRRLLPPGCVDDEGGGVLGGRDCVLDGDADEEAECSKAERLADADAELVIEGEDVGVGLGDTPVVREPVGLGVGLGLGDGDCDREGTAAGLGVAVAEGDGESDMPTKPGAMERNSAFVETGITSINVSLPTSKLTSVILFALTTYSAFTGALLGTI